MTLSVSVVIPAYNAERTLAACLDSVYGQTSPVHEVIVVDDGSTDRTAAIAQGYPCTLISGGGNRGVSAARNAGVAAATGEVVFFLDSDEALTEDSVANAVEILLDDPECACVHGLMAPDPLFDDGPVERYRMLHSYWWRVRGVGESQTAFFSQGAVRRAVFDHLGGFDESLRDSEDLEFSDRLAPHYRIVMTDRIMAYHDDEYRLRPLLGEIFRRAQLLVPAMASARRGGRSNLTANTPGSVGTAALFLATLPFPFWYPLLPVLAFLAFCGANAGLLRFVARHRGLGFVPFCAGMHLLVHVVLLTGAAVGALRMLGGKATGRQTYGRTAAGR